MTDDAKIAEEQQGHRAGETSGGREVSGKISRREFLAGTAIAATGLEPTADK